MAFDPYDFFVLRPLRWAWGQMFGSKAKVYFDKELAPSINAIVHGSDALMAANELVAKIVESTTFSKMLNELLGYLHAPAKYREIATEFLKMQIEAQVQIALGKVIKH